MAKLRDCVAPGLRVLFVGINPGTRSAAIGHHFAGYSNRFWKLLYESGLVPDAIGCEDDRRLPGLGYGVTNLIARSTPGIDTLAPGEYAEGRRALLRKVRRYKPQMIALVGITVYRALFRPAAGESVLGLRPERFGDTPVFVLPNPSGRNANFTYDEMLACYRQLADLRGVPRKGRARIGRSLPE